MRIRRLLARALAVTAALVLAELAAAGLTVAGFLVLYGAGEAPLLGLVWLATLMLLRQIIPGALLIVAAEALRLRSVVVYAVAGAVATLSFYGRFGTASRAVPDGALREAAILIVAGVAAGVLYWALAGRRAGAWRPPRLAPAEHVHG